MVRTDQGCAAAAATIAGGFVLVPSGEPDGGLAGAPVPLGTLGISCAAGLP